MCIKIRGFQVPWLALQFMILYPQIQPAMDDSVQILCTSRPAQFKPLLYKGQLQIMVFLNH